MPKSYFQWLRSICVGMAMKSMDERLQSEPQAWYPAPLSRPDRQHAYDPKKKDSAMRGKVAFAR